MARQRTGNDEQTTLRISSEMMTKIRELSEQENRSLNAQLVTLLQEALAHRAQREPLS